MKTQKHLFLILFLFLILVLQNNSFAEQPAGMLLELPTSARAGGMAECFTALADGPFGIYYNPAGISFIKEPTASFLYQQYLQDINGSFAAVAIPGRQFSFNVAPGLIAMKEEPIYDSAGNDTGKKFNYGGTIIPVSGAYRLNSFSFGATAKYYKEEIDSAVQDVMTFDLGAIYKFKKASFGASYLNMSGKLGDYDLPKTIKFGVAYTISRTNLLFDYNSQITAQKNNFNIGGEMPVYDILFIRLGYKSREDFGGLSYGLGIKMGKFYIDFAASSYSEIGMTQRASFSYCFGRETENAEKGEVTTLTVKRKSRSTDIAIAEFIAKNISAAEGSEVTDNIRNELSSEGLDVLNKADMETTFAEHSFQISGCASEECAVEIGKLLNTKIVIIGSISKIIDNYYVSASLVDVETGKTLQSIVQKGTSAAKLKNACKLALLRKHPLFH